MGGPTSDFLDSTENEGAPPAACPERSRRAVFEGWVRCCRKREIFTTAIED